MDFYKELRQQWEATGDDYSQAPANGRVVEEFGLPFPLPLIPLSLLRLAIHYLRDRTIKPDQAESLKQAVLRLFDEVVVPYDTPLPDAFEVPAENFIRAILVYLLDKELGL